MKHCRAKAQKKAQQAVFGGRCRPLACGIEQDRPDAGETALKLDVAHGCGFEQDEQQLIVGNRGKATSQILDLEPCRPRGGCARAALHDRRAELHEARGRKREVRRAVPWLRQCPQHQGANAKGVRGEFPVPDALYEQRLGPAGFLDGKGPCHSRQRACPGALVLAVGQERMNEVIERAGMVRRERKCAFEICDRRFDAAELEKHAAAPVEGIDVTAIGGERPVIARKRFLVARKLGKHVAAVEVGFGKVRLQGQGPVVAADRIVMAAEPMQGRAQVEPVADRGGLQGDRAFIAHHRFRGPAELHQCAGPIAVGIGKIRLMDDRMVEARKRFLVPAEPTQSHAEKIVRAGLIRLARERAPRQLDAFAEAPLLASDHRQVVERRRVIRLASQHFPIAALGVGHRPLPVQGERPPAASRRSGLPWDNPGSGR
jgi:hypothetical protein